MVQATEFVWVYPPFVRLLTAEMHGDLALFLKLRTFFRVPTQYWPHESAMNATKDKG